MSTGVPCICQLVGTLAIQITGDRLGSAECHFESGGDYRKVVQLARRIRITTGIQFDLLGGAGTGLASHLPIGDNSSAVYLRDRPQCLCIRFVVPARVVLCHHFF